MRFAFSPYAHWSQGRFIWWLALFVLYGVFRVFFFRVSSWGGVWSGLMLVALAQIVIGQLQLMDILPAQHSLFKISGSFFNPAPYGGFLAVLFPLALYEAVKKEGARPAWRKYLAWLVVAGALLVILPAQSRAAWLALVAGSAWVLVDRFRLFTRLRQWPKPRLAVAAALLVSLSAFGAYWLYQFKADSASGRLLVWKVSAGMWLEKPLFGHD